nr:EOG090X07W1 [Macrothrix elegans]
MQHHEQTAHKVSPQLALAAFQFLSSSIEPFKSEWISESVLRRLMRHHHVIRCLRVRNADKSEGDTNTLIYQQNKPADYFVLILEGRVEVTIGKENLVFESGPFSYFGLQSLTGISATSNLVESPSAIRLSHSVQSVQTTSSPETGMFGVGGIGGAPRGGGQAFFTDYTVRATTDVVYFRLNRSLYQAAVSATALERARDAEQRFTDGDSSFQLSFEVSSREPIEEVKETSPLMTQDNNLEHSGIYENDRVRSSSGLEDGIAKKNSPNGLLLITERTPKKENGCYQLYYPNLRNEVESGSSASYDSLRLVSMEEYNTLYRELKSKYVPGIAKVWPECTDPEKFIHEDIAIATYLILVWRKEHEKLNLDSSYKQSFLDIGCGNGLLVYLLNSEGYPGKGIDIRSRKIWALYPPGVNLEVCTLVPSEDTSFIEYDWLLGNHSDELTPWLPVIALQSSARRQPDRLPTNFWVLPCCPFSFFGKFQREKFNASSKSRYSEYLNFVENVSQTCGFQVERDRLRIPSTKRICFLGFSSSKEASEWSHLLKLKSHLISESDDQVAQASFQPRPAEESVRNCTRVERSILDTVVDLTAKCLLDRSPKPSQEEWNSGGIIPLPELVELLGREFKEFHRLKNECGGIQTLLRNHSHIFVVENKSVRFRSPTELSSSEWRNSHKLFKVSAKRKLAPDATTPAKKTKLCWFYKNHPNGCPLTSDTCRYLHS